MGIETALAVQLGGAALGAIAGKKGGAKGAEAAPTTFQSLPQELQNLSTQQAFPRLEELFNRPAEATAKRQAISPQADPLFASPELFALQQFANANQGATSQAQANAINNPQPLPSETDQFNFTSTDLANEFISKAGSGGGVRASGLIPQNIENILAGGDLSSLSQELGRQGFTAGQEVTPNTFSQISLADLMRAATGQI